MLRAIALLSLCLSAVASAADGPDAGTATPAYVATSWLVAPRNVGDFALEGSHYDADNKSAGAGFRYALKDRQELRVDLYVYPAGQLEQADAIKAGMQAFRLDLATATEHGSYERVVELDQTRFTLESPDVGTRPAANAIDAAAIAAMTDAGRISGERLRMTLQMQPGDWPMRSNGYLFHRQLYYFKLRVSAAQERIGQDDFDALADQAARLLVPAVQAIHVGDCARATINVDPNAPPEQGAATLMTQLMRIKGRNCHRSAQHAGIDGLSKDAEIVRIVYAADEWTSQ